MASPSIAIQKRLLAVAVPDPLAVAIRDVETSLGTGSKLKFIKGHSIPTLIETKIYSSAKGERERRYAEREGPGGFGSFALALDHPTRQDA